MHHRMNNVILLAFLTSCSMGTAPVVNADPNGPEVTIIFGDPADGGQPLDSESDQDGDGHANYANGGDDCNDSRADINPSAVDDTCNGINEDCSEDGRDGEDSPLRDSNDCGVDDDDGDGVGEEDANGVTLDCDDGDPDVFPGAGFNEHDVDDRSKCMQDADHDGFGDDRLTASQEDDGLEPGSDCEDNNALVHPNANDTDLNGVDDDCDGRVDSQGSGDGEFEDEDCDSWDVEFDCDDDDEYAYPFAGRNEEFSDNDFEDFPWLCCRDRDRDGYCDDTVSASDEDDGMIEGTDCDDDNANVYPDEDGDCVDHGTGGEANTGILEMRVENRAHDDNNRPPSWEVWYKNTTRGEWTYEWYGYPTRMCGHSTTDFVTCTDLVGYSGDYIMVNGAFDDGGMWLVMGNTLYIDSLTINGDSYNLSMTVDDTPDFGDCNKASTSTDLVCRLW